MKTILLTIAIVITLSACEQKTRVCVAPTKVDKILTVHYREAAVQLSNGRTVIASTDGNLQPGDDFCEQWEWK